jgi:hypothetical protein
LGHHLPWLSMITHKSAVAYVPWFFFNNMGYEPDKYFLPLWPINYMETWQNLKLVGSFEYANHFEILYNLTQSFCIYLAFYLSFKNSDLLSLCLWSSRHLLPSLEKMFYHITINVNATYSQNSIVFAHSLQTSVHKCH